MLIQAPHEILRSIAKPVDFSGPKLKKLIEEMKAILASQADPEGVGLAANQIGLPYSIFVTRTHVFVNPEIVAHSEELQPEKNKKSPLEGCLSLPRYYGLVKRYQWVKVKHQKLDPVTGLLGNWVTDLFKGFSSMVIQHEMDHLNGKIFVERILEQKGKLYKIVGKDSKGKEKWEEVEI